jgi:hypothetical protein
MIQSNELESDGQKPLRLPWKGVAWPADFANSGLFLRFASTAGNGSARGVLLIKRIADGRAFSPPNRTWLG